MRRHLLAVVAIGVLLLAGCVSIDDSGSQASQDVQASQSPQESAQSAPGSETEEAVEELGETSDGDTSAGSEQQPSEAIGSISENVETSASSLSTLIESLQVAEETPNGYDRDLFKHWVDADGDGCNAREEVLIAESLKKVTVGSGCSISGGEWVSAFDLVVTTNPSNFDVDHFVPLKEAWDSGASEWNSATRQSFANDLGYEMSLIAVSASSNRSKSDRDPADWLPPNNDYRCEYAVAWAQVKSRWSLSIDPKEKVALLELADECGNGNLEFKPKAPVTQESSPAASTTPSPTPTPNPTKTASPSPTPAATASQASSACQPGQVDINIASVEELKRIKHISDARAPLVVDSRPYTSLDQLTRVKGIAAGRLADIKAEGIACVG
jgi:DNA uptake protein ComE-like DNA-binding protein/outer membrane murein-binding lipoprotein Lpp